MFNSLYEVQSIPNVGAGLLANAVYQLRHLYLIDRIREQARSHTDCIPMLDSG